MSNQNTITGDDARRMTVLLQVLITPEMADRLEAIETRDGTTRSAFTRLALDERLDRYEALKP